jgi:hypothetical protein
MTNTAGDQKPETSVGQPEMLSRHEERQRRREERWAARGGRHGGTWVLGGILILLGIIFLLQNMGLAFLSNWWALFILLPAFGAFTAAWRTYQGAGGHLTAASRGSLIGGLVLTMIAAIFLFNLNWTILGPALLILAGIGILLNALLPG